MENNIHAILSKLDKELEKKRVIKTDRLVILLAFKEYLLKEFNGNTEEAEKLNTRCKLLIAKALVKADTELEEEYKLLLSAIGHLHPLKNSPE